MDRAGPRKGKLVSLGKEPVRRTLKILKHQRSYFIHATNIGLSGVHGSEQHPRIWLFGANVPIQGSIDPLLCLLDVHLLELSLELKSL